VTSPPKKKKSWFKKRRKADNDGDYQKALDAIDVMDAETRRKIAREEIRDLVKKGTYILS
jgi:hypothetical protein